MKKLAGKCEGEYIGRVYIERECVYGRKRRGGFEGKNES